jgi:uncharacterized membrane protein YbhN (UPF0104 family)
MRCARIVGNLSVSPLGRLRRLGSQRSVLILRSNPLQERRLRRGILTGVLLSILLGGLVLAVPGLSAVSDSIRHARPGWLVLASVLEVASCLGYVLAFQGTFERLPRRFAALVAASELAFGAVVPLGVPAGSLPADGSWRAAGSRPE